jgi:polyisoprenyl-teichoic acid--peptidoglycan teichoic acid transferase
MATSPPDENNWEDSKSAETSTSSEPPTAEQEAQTEGDIQTSLDASTPQEKDTLSHQPIEQKDQEDSPTLPDDPTQENSSTSPETPTQHVTPKKRLRRGVKILLIALAVLLVLGSATAGAGYYYYTTTIQKPLAQIYRPVARSKQEATPQATATSAPVYDVIKGKSWNILLLGSDNDDKYVFPDVLTQVMMIVHVDTVKNTVTMVSIPRDSWVSVPGFGMHKIDQAFSLGEQQTGKFDDGVLLARETVEADYGVTIDRYAWVGLDGFAKVIDTLGGIDINVAHPIVDDSYPNDVGSGSNSGNAYAYKRLYIAPGPQHLDGQEALEYVRSRHSDLVGDIGRTQRQQQVLEALKLKLNVTTIIADIPQLLSDLSGNIYTDLTDAEMLAFANYGRTLINNPIQTVTLGVGAGNQDYGDLETIYDPSVGADQDIVQPNCINIQPEINSIFGLGNAQSCNTGG